MGLIRITSNTARSKIHETLITMIKKRILKTNKHRSTKTRKKHTHTHARTHATTDCHNVKFWKLQWNVTAAHTVTRSPHSRKLDCEGKRVVGWGLRETQERERVRGREREECHVQFCVLWQCLGVCVLRSHQPAPSNNGVVIVAIVASRWR